MDKSEKDKSIIFNEKRQLIERIEKLEIGFIMLLNQLENTKGISKLPLNILKKIILGVNKP